MGLGTPAKGDESNRSEMISGTGKKKIMLSNSNFFDISLIFAFSFRNIGHFYFFRH